MKTIVGDITGNASKILAAMERADVEGAQVVVVPELAITGYPPEDLLLKKTFVAANRSALDRIAAASTDVLAVVGFVERDEGQQADPRLPHGGRAARVHHDGLAVGIGVATAIALAGRVWFLSRLFPSFQILVHSARAIAPTLPATAAEPYE